MIAIDGVIYSWHNYGGIAVYFENILNELDNRCIDYRLYDYGGYKGSSANTINVEPRFLERYRLFNTDEDFGVFHSSYYRRCTNPLARVVVTVHDFVYEKFMDPVRRVIHSTQKFKAIRNADVIVCVSNSTKSDLLHYLPDVSDKEIVVIHNGYSNIYRGNIELNTFPLNYSLFVGGRGGYKNFRDAVNLIRQHPSMILKVVGGGPLSIDEKLLLDSAIPNRYEFLGFVSDVELSKMYSNAYCLIYPSLYEGFGIPLLEAMAAGCPVVAYNNSSIPEVVGKYISLANSGDILSLSSIFFALADKHYRSNSIAAGASQADKFSWSISTESMIDIYNSLC